MQLKLVTILLLSAIVLCSLNEASAGKHYRKRRSLQHLGDVNTLPLDAKLRRQNWIVCSTAFFVFVPGFLRATGLLHTKSSTSSQSSSSNDDLTTLVLKRLNYDPSFLPAVPTVLVSAAFYYIVIPRMTKSNYLSLNLRVLAVVASSIIAPMAFNASIQNHILFQGDLWPIVTTVLMVGFVGLPLSRRRGNIVSFVFVEVLMFFLRYNDGWFVIAWSAAYGCVQIYISYYFEHQAFLEARTKMVTTSWEEYLSAGPDSDDENPQHIDEAETDTEDNNGINFDMDSNMTLIVVIAAIGGFVLLAIIIGLIAALVARRNNNASASSGMKSL